MSSDVDKKQTNVQQMTLFTTPLDELGEKLCT